MFARASTTNGATYNYRLSHTPDRDVTLNASAGANRLHEIVVKLTRIGS